MSNITVKNSVKTVEFVFIPSKSLWSVKVNDSFLTSWNGYYMDLVSLGCLKDAVEYCKGKGLIPIDFSANALLHNNQVQIILVQ